jgi:hypothetical protein
MLVEQHSSDGCLHADVRCVHCNHMLSAWNFQNCPQRRNCLARTRQRCRCRHNKAST